VPGRFVIVGASAAGLTAAEVLRPAPCGHRWQAGSGLLLGNGVECDDRCLAGPRVWAAGEVASWPTRTSVAPGCGWSTG
jgi:hypothetical protein